MASQEGSASVSRKKRGLSEQERQLWEHVARSVKPFSDRKQIFTIPEADKPIFNAVEPYSSSDLPIKPAPKPHPIPQQGFDQATLKTIKKGKRAIDARLDLHGLTQDRAYQTLAQFVQRSFSKGARLALVITGKGSSKEGQGSGILRRMVPLWLQMSAFSPYIVRYEEAQPRHGGAGALYLHMRKNPQLREDQEP
jgi:DNA-nicking Smr family endonuclease